MTALAPAPATALQRRPCPSCRGGSDRLRLQLDFLEGYPAELCLVRCRLCGSERIDPHPPAEAMARHYDRDYYEEGYLPFSTRRRADFRRRLRELERLEVVRAARRQGRAPRCLDLGAGVGLFALEAQAAGWQVTAVEPSAPARHLAREKWGLELQAAPPGCGDTYDLVTLWDVLGHVDDPEGTLRSARERLARGGAVVIKIPNFQSTWHRMRDWMSARRRVNLLHAPSVLWRFSRRGAVLLLERCDLHLVACRTVREPDLLPLTGRWRAVRRVTDVADALLDNRQEMILYARAG